MLLYFPPSLNVRNERGPMEFKRRFLILSEKLLAITIKRNIYEEILKDFERIFRVKKKRLKEENLQLC